MSSRAGQGAVATTWWCCRAVVLSSPGPITSCAGGRVVLSFFWVTRAARVPTTRAPTIEPDSDKTRPHCSRIRPDRLTPIRRGMSGAVWGCLGTSRAVAVSRVGCSQNRGEIRRTESLEVSNAETRRRRESTDMPN
jgi:hypothetical protein